jgi:hypothetical protein
MKIFAKLTHYRAYKKNPTALNRNNLEGEIYELYCYNYLLENSKNIHFIKSRATEYMESNGFYNAKIGGKLLYMSNSIDLAEFDVIGISENELYCWEISKAAGTVSRRNEIKSFKRKNGLLNILFKGMNINFKVVIPNENLIYFNYDNIIIEEPDYDKLIYDYEKYNGYSMNENFNECYDLYELGKRCIDYNYYNEIIKYSEKLFIEKDISFLNYLENNGIIEYLYDIKNMNKTKFEYYDIQKKVYSLIEFRKNKWYRNKKRIKGIKIKGIKNELKKAGYFA